MSLWNLRIVKKSGPHRLKNLITVKFWYIFLQFYCFINLYLNCSIVLFHYTAHSMSKSSKDSGKWSKDLMTLQKCHYLCSFWRQKYSSTLFAMLCVFSTNNRCFQFLGLDTLLPMLGCKPVSLSSAMFPKWLLKTRFTDGRFIFASITHELSMTRLAIQHSTKSFLKQTSNNLN